MKLLAALAVFGLFAVVIASGMVLTVAKGNPWLLVAGLGAFTVLFWRVGCTEH